MQKNGTIPQYLSMFKQCHGELGQVGITVVEDDLVSLTLLGLPKSQHNYQYLVNGREKLPNQEWLQCDLVQQEINQNTRDKTSSKGKDEDKYALDGREKKGKGKKYQSKAESSQWGKKKHLSKSKCFHCHEFRHFFMKIPHKKTRNNIPGVATGESLASNFNLEFTLIAYIANTVMGSRWYLYSGVLFYIIGNRDFLSDLEEKDLQMHIKMGDDGRYCWK